MHSPILPTHGDADPSLAKGLRGLFEALSGKCLQKTRKLNSGSKVRWLKSLFDQHLRFFMMSEKEHGEMVLQVGFLSHISYRVYWGQAVSRCFVVGLRSFTSHASLTHRALGKAQEICGLPTCP